MKLKRSVSEQILDKLENACKQPLKNCGRGEVLFDCEYIFPNRYFMVVQVIASENPDKEPAWTQGVLYDNEGNEIGCTDVGESFIGEYHVNKYTVEIVR